MRGLFFILFFVFINSCAKVAIQSPKEPIKIDITMRLDVYQHIMKDIEDIDNIVYQDKKTNNQSSLISFFIDTAYAQSVSKEVEEAALRRRDRLNQLTQLQKAGIVGENKDGLLEILKEIDESGKSLVEDENTDRMIIYRALAKKNSVSVEEIQKLYAKNNQEKAPTGTPIEVLDAISGEYSWKIK